MHLTRRQLLQAAALGGAAAAWPTDLAHAADDVRPRTVPALRTWAPAAGPGFALCSPMRVIVVGGHERVRTTAELLAGELRQLGATAAVAPSTGRAPGAGEVRLDLQAADPALGAEGYRLRVGAGVTISANQPAGVYYGTRTLLQLLRQGPIPAGVARDWPRYAERGLMLDIGRKHLTAPWIAARIVEMAGLKLNLLHLHFSENLGWRIASDGHPEVVSEEHLTKAQVRQLLALADLHHVTVVPEIDMPGHMGAALVAHPELQLRDVLGRSSPNNLDYTIPAARRFAFELIDEYLDLFPGPFWHAGADEYLGPPGTPLDEAMHPQLEAYAKEQHGPDATAKDGILGLVNSIDDRVRARGRSLRVWNDGLSGGRAVVVHPQITVEWWTDMNGPSPAALVAAGHRVLNAGYYPTYYINGFPGGFVPGYPNGMPVPPKATARDGYERWEVNRFSGPLFFDGTVMVPPQVLSPDERALTGSKLHVWNDGPDAATEAEIAVGMRPYLHVMAQKTWASPLLTPSFDAFLGVIDRVRTGAPAVGACSAVAGVAGAPAPTGTTTASPLPATGGGIPLWPAAALVGLLALRGRRAGAAGG